jgi:aspartyl-tRNA(Asn)/glutamyl-tRNA(Gln) amidotransferase subunit A
MADELWKLSAHELAGKIRRREVSAREAALSVIERIHEVEESVKAFVTVTEDLALTQADAVDAAIARGEELGPLAGVPVAIKDNMCTCGTLTTCSSKILYNWKPPYNATVVDALANAGMVTVGKTNLDEFAMGSSTENSGFFTTHNPWDLSKVPGGSSGGSAAAVAAGEAPVALGSDTGGSIRQPASFCGVVGLKPTYGRVSRYGLVAFASSLDQIGPFARNVRDAAALLQVIAGPDPCDSTSAPMPVPDYSKPLLPDIKGLKIGVPKEFFVQGVAPEVSEAIWNALDKLAELGASCEETSMPSVEHGVATYYIIAPAEASSNLARYDGVRYGLREKADDPISMFENTREQGFGAEVKQRIMIGTYALSAGYYDAYYLKAQKVRTLFRREFEKAFEKYDVLITPTTPTVAFGIGELADDPLAMKLADVCTIPVNLAGIPAISIPCGFSKGLPIGLHIIGRGFDEETVLRVAYAYEQNTDHHTKGPGVTPKGSGARGQGSGG